eukprot:scaffold2352_cov90-Skeletonema_dohrnii-CCMP3373.AAC.7
MSAGDCEAGYMMMMMMMCCASCGKSEVDEVKLKECADCDLVRYCSDECQENHTAQHEEACKKRAAELRDEILFKQPESSHHGDCPICCLPMPLDESKSTMHLCCSKVICNGCSHANNLRIKEERREYTCLFCREPVLSTVEERDKRRTKRIEVNDPVAMCREGVKQYVKADYSSALEYFTRAAELENVEAHHQLSLMYYNGHGVEKDRGKEVHHLEEAAIRGHPSARYNLGCHEWDNGNTERAVTHWIIAAAQGRDDAIIPLMDEFRSGIVSKDDLAAALRAHQAAVDATKSPQREAAEEYRRKMKSSK